MFQMGFSCVSAHPWRCGLYHSILSQKLLKPEDHARTKAMLKSAASFGWVLRYVNSEGFSANLVVLLLLLFDIPILVAAHLLFDVLFGFCDK